MSIAIQILLILAQLGLLVLNVLFAGSRSRFVFHRWFNVGTWYAIFFLLWMLIPQALAIAFHGELVGFADSDPRVVIRSQIYLLAYSVCFTVGFCLVNTALPRHTRFHPTLLARELTPLDRLWLASTYLAGLAAVAYLGYTWMGTDEFRSVLVKSAPGLIATIVGFYGLVALSVLISHRLIKRHFTAAALILLPYAGAIFFTGARGRLLWPIALALAYTMSAANRVRTRMLVGFSLLGGIALFSFDPILNGLRLQQSASEILENLYSLQIYDMFMVKRNFDGFANFALASTSHSAGYDYSILWKGGRETFMTQYFPDIYKTGVGFGTSVPGMLWLAGGFPFLLLFGFGYGFALGTVNVAVRFVHSEPLIWCYLFAMPWLCAVGGNLPESIDKMLAAASPGFVWLLLQNIARHRRSVPL